MEKFFEDFSIFLAISVIAGIFVFGLMTLITLPFIT